MSESVWRKRQRFRRFEMRTDKADSCVPDPEPDLRRVPKPSIRRAQSRRKDVDVEPIAMGISGSRRSSALAIPGGARTTHETTAIQLMRRFILWPSARSGPIRSSPNRVHVQRRNFATLERLSIEDLRELWR